MPKRAGQSQFNKFSDDIKGDLLQSARQIGQDRAVINKFSSYVKGDLSYRVIDKYDMTVAGTTSSPVMLKGISVIE